MLRSSLFTVSAIALMAGAAAQTSPQTLKAEKVPGAIKHAGIYHVSTGTWTRTGGAVANFGPDTIYSNTATSGYFSSAGGAGGFAPLSTNFDEGQVPSTGNTNAGNLGNRDAYNVNCIEIGYCDNGAAGSGGWELSFYDSYTPCTFDGAPDNTVLAAGLPAGGCWTVAFDLSGGLEICLAGDGGDGFDSDLALDSFGWSYRYTGTDGTAPAGFLLTGDPESTDPNYVIGGNPVDGTNTYYGVASACSPDLATGLSTRDFWWLEDPAATNSNCYFFGGYSNNNGCGGPSNPFASWFMELQADTGPCSSVISAPYGCASNPNSTGVNSTMEASGSTSVAADNVTLTAAVTVNSFGFFITSQNQGFSANPGGSAGNICLGANVGRFQQLAANSGAAGLVSISTAAGQWSLASIPQASGPYSAVAGGTANFQCWHRDSSMTGPTSNFTDGVTVTWTN
ncbi:MAG: hypothetical protein ACI80K_003768 [Paracoccaceae bacterium]|jgi:hypothetical protein